MIHGKPTFILLAACCLSLLLSIGAAGADDPGSVQDQTPGSEGVDAVYEESEGGNEETTPENDTETTPEISPVQDRGESGSEVEDSSVYEPVEGEITEGQYRSYVLAFLLFFTVVIVCYFGYKFFAMFF